jgi:hypothetical protein
METKIDPFFLQIRCDRQYDGLVYGVLGSINCVDVVEMLDVCKVFAKTPSEFYSTVPRL